jgi:hypothetical protein
MFHYNTSKLNLMLGVKDNPSSSISGSRNGTLVTNMLQKLNLKCPNKTRVVVEVADEVEAAVVAADGLDYRSIVFDLSSHPHQRCTYIVSMVFVVSFAPILDVLIALFAVIFPCGTSQCSSNASLY